MFLIFLSFSFFPPRSYHFLCFYMSHCVAQAVLYSVSSWLSCPNSGLAKICHRIHYILILVKYLIIFL